MCLALYFNSVAGPRKTEDYDRLSENICKDSWPKFLDIHAFVVYLFIYTKCDDRFTKPSLSLYKHCTCRMLAI